MCCGRLAGRAQGQGRGRERAECGARAPSVAARARVPQARAFAAARGGEPARGSTTRRSSTPRGSTPPNFELINYFAGSCEKYNTGFVFQKIKIFRFHFFPCFLAEPMSTNNFHFFGKRILYRHGKQSESCTACETQTNPVPPSGSERILHTPE